MSVTGTLLADGTIQVLCPKVDCSAILRVKPRSGRTWVTCAAEGCGHRFVLDVPGFASAPASGSQPASPPPLPPAKNAFAFVLDDAPTREASPKPARPNSDRPKRKPKREEAKSGSGMVVALVAGGAIAVLLLGGGLVFGLIWVLRDKDAGSNNPGPVAQNTIPAPLPVFTPPPAAVDLPKSKPDSISNAKSPAVATKPAIPPTPIEMAPDEPVTPKTDPDARAQAPVKGPAAKKSPAGSKDAIEKVKRSTALIEINKTGWGTGFVIRSGIVMTNFHVIARAPLEDLKVSFVSLDDTAPAPLKPTLLYCNPERDLAILRVDTDRPPLEMCAAGTELSGLQVAIVGNPRGDGGQANINKVTTGRLAAPVRRNAEWTYFELRAEAFFGNSGGPVVDANTGKLVGVIQSILGNGKTKSYCIPFGEANKALDRLPASREKEPDATKIATARHYLDYFNHEMPIVENMAGNAMNLQMLTLKAKALGGGARVEVRDRLSGKILSGTEVMTQLKEEYAKSYALLEKRLSGPIKASPEVPSALISQARLRLEACGAMRALAGGKTDTEAGFRKQIDNRQTASDKAARAFKEEYDKFLEKMDGVK